MKTYACWMRWLAWLWFVALAGPVGCGDGDSGATTCSDGRVCASGYVCDEAHHACATPTQLAECQGQAQAAPCSYPGVPNGACDDGVCLPAGCGNGAVDPGEACDDGNRVSGDGCSADCGSNETCGNGAVDPREACDDGNRVSGDGCSADCGSNETCGNGAVDPGEECDNGTGNSDTGRNACRTNCRGHFCGDHVVDSGEACDDGNRVSGDGCSADCTSNETCGNHIVDPGEQCDDGNHVSGQDGCQADCTLPTCGDGIVDATLGEQCDDGLANSDTVPGACRTNCQRHCGDHVIDIGETCDDGNQVSGDGCSADCTSSEACGNGIVDVAVGEQCDDGNAQSHDGCSGCQVEPTTWEKGPSESPPARRLPAMAYDAAHGRVVLFGGDGGSTGFLSDTRLWDGITWTKVPLATGSTPPFLGAAMAYDAARGKVVLVGSGFTVGFLGTWEWDGSTWTNATPATGSPPPRAYHALAYDAARGKVVLFGGYNGGVLADTWEWDGSTWTKVTPATGSPPARADHALAYDAARGKVVLFGGSDSSNHVLADTWEWDGSTWTNATPATGSPAPRAHHALAYDPARGKVVLFGGSDSSNHALADTWAWDGSTWTNMTPAAGSPAARADHALAYDAARGKVVLFGGSDRNNNLLADTWAWDGSTWTPASGSPPGRFDLAMAYDAARGKVVMFGGVTVNTAGSGYVYLADTWEWDGSSWTNVTPALFSPPGRASHVMAYDAARGKVVLFGGTNHGGWLGPSFADTWEWDGSSWTNVTPASGSPPSGGVMTYCAARGKVVLFAGGAGGTWEWDGSSWTNVTPVSGSAPAGVGYVMAYDAARGKVVLFGGVDTINGIPSYLAATWEWDGSTWTNVTPASGSPSGGGAMAYDAARGKVVLFGGLQHQQR